MVPNERAVYRSGRRRDIGLRPSAWAIRPPPSGLGDPASAMQLRKSPPPNSHWVGVRRELRPGCAVVERGSGPLGRRIEPILRLTAAEWESGDPPARLGPDTCRIRGTTQTRSRG